MGTTTRSTREGITMELWPSKNGASTLGTHGVRDHANDPNNVIETKKKWSCNLILTEKIIYKI